MMSILPNNRNKRWLWVLACIAGVAVAALIVTCGNHLGEAKTIDASSYRVK